MFMGAQTLTAGDGILLSKVMYRRGKGMSDMCLVCDHLDILALLLAAQLSCVSTTSEAHRAALPVALMNGTLVSVMLCL